MLDIFYFAKSCKSKHKLFLLFELFKAMMDSFVDLFSLLKGLFLADVAYNKSVDNLVTQYLLKTSGEERNVFATVDGSK